jgi:hypothetical protein
VPPAAKPNSPKPSAPAKKKSDKKKFLAIGALLTSTPFLIAIAVHVLLLLAGGSIVIFKGGNPLAIFTSQDVGGDAGAEAEAPPSPEEEMPEPESEPMPMETEVAPTEVEESSDILALSTPSTVPSFAPPAPAKATTTTITGSSGTSRGGPGVGGPQKKARSGKSTLFGFEEAMEDDLIGTMIDLKQDASGKKPTGMGIADTDFYRAARELLAGQRVNEGALRKYFTVPKKLGATQIFIPTCDASEAPKVFGVADKVKPNYWLVRYQGRFAAPLSGQYRFVGKADDLLWVAVDGRTVLEAHWDVDNFLTNWRPKDHLREHSIYDFMGGNTEGDRERAFLTYGDWMNLEAGKPKDLEILVGEYGGGRFFAVLMIQSKDQEGKSGKSKSRPPIPLFVIAEPSAQQRQAMRASKLEVPRELPVFAASQTPGAAQAMPTSPDAQSAAAPPAADGRADTASASTYGGEWKEGVAADGWEGWTLRANGNPDKKSYAGFYLAKQEEKSGSEPVTTEGRSFAIFADGEGFQEAAAFRGLAQPLQANQTFSVDFVTPLPKSNAGTTGSIGVTLRSGRQADEPKDYNAGSRFELAALQGQPNYQIFDGSQPPDSGLPVTPAGFRLEFTLKTPDTYDLKLYPLSGGSPIELKDRKLGGTAGAPLESVSIFNRDSEQNAFFNRLRLNP